MHHDRVWPMKYGAAAVSRPTGYLWVSALVVLTLATPAAADDAATEAPADHRLASASAVAGVYAVFGAYAYFAWFHQAHEVPFFVISDWRDENPFAVHSYAGGADKFGHCWFNYIMTRSTTELLADGGWNRFGASLVSAGLTETAFFLSEVKDGFIWGFEVGDFAANMTGAALAVLLENSPTLDRLFDFRLDYFPSSDYRYLVRSMPFFQRGNGIDFTQDYSGQSYLLALHVRELPVVGTQPWAPFVDVVGGFETRGFDPAPREPGVVPRQIFYAGIALNMQGVLDAVFPDSLGRKLGHAFFEVVSIPYTTLRFGEATRSP